MNKDSTRTGQGARRDTTRDSTRDTPATPRRHAAATEGGGAALNLWVVLARAYQSVGRLIEADIATHGLTTTEFGVLEVLYHKGPLLLGEVQRKILVTSGGITYLVDRLARKGLVERRDCPEDRRARYAALTPAGRALVKRIFPAHQRSIERALAGLAPEQQRQAAALLRALGRAAAGLEAGTVGG